MQPIQSASLEAWLWLATLAVVLALLGLAYAYLLLYRRRSKLLRCCDAWLSRSVPVFWSSMKSSISGASRRRLGLAVLLAAFLVTSYLFAELTESWLDKQALLAIDHAVYRALSDTLSPAVEQLLYSVTQLGSVYASWTISCCLLLVFYQQRARRDAVALALIMLVGSAIVWGFKFAFARARPQASLVDAAGDAFPSAHAFTAVALYGFIIYLVWGWTQHSVLRVAATALLAALALLIGVSRVLLRVHWVSDVLGGFVLGLGWLVVSLLAARLMR